MSQKSQKSALCLTKSPFTHRSMRTALPRSALPLSYGSDLAHTLNAPGFGAENAPDMP